MLGVNFGGWDRYSICFVFQISSFDLGDNLGHDLDRSFGPVDQHYAQLRNVELGQSSGKQLPSSLNGSLKGIWGKKIHLLIAVKLSSQESSEAASGSTWLKNGS